MFGANIEKRKKKRYNSRITAKILWTLFLQQQNKQIKSEITFLCDGQFFEFSKLFIQKRGVKKFSMIFFLQLYELKFCTTSIICLQHEGVTCNKKQQPLKPKRSESIR